MPLVEGHVLQTLVRYSRCCWRIDFAKAIHGSNKDLEKRKGLSTKKGCGRFLRPWRIHCAAVTLQGRAKGITCTAGEAPRLTVWWLARLQRAGPQPSEVKGKLDRKVELLDWGGRGLETCRVAISYRQYFISLSLGVWNFLCNHVSPSVCCRRRNDEGKTVSLSWSFWCGKRTESPKLLASLFPSSRSRAGERTSTIRKWPKKLVSLIVDDLAGETSSQSFLRWLHHHCLLGCWQSNPTALILVQINNRSALSYWLSSERLPAFGEDESSSSLFPALLCCKSIIVYHITTVAH